MYFEYGIQNKNVRHDFMHTSGILLLVYGIGGEDEIVDTTCGLVYVDTCPRYIGYRTDYRRLVTEI